MRSACFYKGSIISQEILWYLPPGFLQNCIRCSYEYVVQSSNLKHLRKFIESCNLDDCLVFLSTKSTLDSVDGLAQLVEHRFCKPAVVGSSPIASSINFEKLLVRLPSGQRQQTVNLSGFPFDGSNPSLATTFLF